MYKTSGIATASAHIEVCVRELTQASDPSTVKSVLCDALLFIKPPTSILPTPTHKAKYDNAESLRAKVHTQTTTGSHPTLNTHTSKKSPAVLLNGLCESELEAMRYALTRLSAGMGLYRKLLETIVSTVGVAWLDCFTQAEKERIYMPFFLSHTQPSVALCVLTTLSAMLKNAKDVDVQSAVVDVLSMMLSSGAIRALWRRESDICTYTSLLAGSNGQTQKLNSLPTDTKTSNTSPASVLEITPEHTSTHVKRPTPSIHAKVKAIAVALRSLPDIAAIAYSVVAPPIPLRHEIFARRLMDELLNDVCGSLFTNGNMNGKSIHANGGANSGGSVDVYLSADVTKVTENSNLTYTNLTQPTVLTENRHITDTDEDTGANIYSDANTQTSTLRNINISRPTTATMHYDITTVGAIISSLCIGGAQTGIVCDVLVEAARTNRKNIANLIACIPETVIDKIVFGILSHKYMASSYTTPTHTYATLDRLLGNRVGDSELTRCQFLLSNTCVVRHTYTPSVGVGIVKLLSEKTPSKLVPMLLNLVQVWGDPVSLRHTAYTHHFYQTVVIVACLPHLSRQLHMDEKLHIITSTMESVHSHINTPILETRRLGMAAAMHIQKALTPEHKLEFEYEVSRDTDLLELIASDVPWPEPEDTLSLSDDTVWASDQHKLSSAHKHMNSHLANNVNLNVNVNLNKPLFGADGSESGFENDQHSDNEETVGSESESESDSDDDLLPYDLPTETVITDMQSLKGPPSPAYIRACVMSMRAQKEPQRVAAGLKSAAKLIKHTHDYNPTMVQEVCVDMLMTLMHLSDEYGVEDHNKYRFDALVEMVIAVPETSGRYLANQFYTDNYNLLQRLDMLKVLEAACVQMASVTKQDMGGSAGYVSTIEPAVPGRHLKPLEGADKAILSEGVRQWGQRIEVTVSGGDEDYADPISGSHDGVLDVTVVQQRVKNSRRFTKAVQATPQYNKFAKIAYSFFYGLMEKFDSEKSRRFLGEAEGMLLSSLLNALGTMMRCAANAPEAVAMATALIDFVFAVRFHTETAVRRSSLYALLTVLTSAPPDMIILDLSAYIKEIFEWLEYVAVSEVDLLTREVAIACTAALNNIDKGIR
eukprot:CFRG0548T1